MKSNWRAPALGICLTACAFLFFTQSIVAQYQFNPSCQKAFKEILMLRFDQAKTLLHEEKRVNQQNPVPVYLENYIDFLTLFISESRVQYDQLKPMRSKRLDKLEAGTQASPYNRFFLAEVNLQWALVRLKFGDYTTAAIELKKAYSLFSENEKRFPDFLPNKMGLGIVHVFVGLIPDNYRWVADLVGVEGSLDQGISELMLVALYEGNDPELVLFRTGAAYYLAGIAANLQRNKKDALTLIGKMDQSGGDQPLELSPLAIFARASIYMKNGLNDMALATLQDRSRSGNTYPFYFLDFLEGITRLNKLDLEGELYFERYVQKFKGMNYLKSACQKLAWIALIKGDTIRYEEYMLQVKKRGSSMVEEDKQAYNEANIGIRPSVVLIRSRLLFDGGYYNQALSELLAHSVKSVVKNRRDFVEYTYRLARIYHEMGNNAKAIDNYRQTINRGKNEPYYFAASSAFHLGLIYENSGLYLQADSAYRLCLSIKTPEYKTSFNMKAKAGLNRIKNVQN